MRTTRAMTRHGAGLTTVTTTAAAVASRASTDNRYPTRDECRSQPRSHSEFPCDTLLLLAAHGDHGACTERLVREVMLVEELDWPTARRQVEAMEDANAPSEAPGNAAAAVTVAAACAALPMTFSKDTALWFNKHYVTAEVPPSSDLDTWLEVGAWTWNWMEPPLGTISFVVLCVQLTHARAISPVLAWAKQRRADALVQRYPQYSPLVLRQWAAAL